MEHMDTEVYKETKIAADFKKVPINHNLKRNRSRWPCNLQVGATTRELKSSNIRIYMYLFIYSYVKIYIYIYAT